MSEPGAVGPLEEQGREREGERRGLPEEYLPQPGMEVAGYRLERRVGRGGQGTVFREVHLPAALGALGLAGAAGAGAATPRAGGCGVTFP